MTTEAEVIDMFRAGGRDAGRAFHPDLRPAQPGLPAEGARLHASGQDRAAVPGAGRRRCGAEGLGRSTSSSRPAVGGIIPGYETARHLGVPAIWVEREDGEFRLRRFEIAEGRAGRHRRGHRHDRPVDPRDGRLPCATLGAEVVAAACLIDRSAGEADVGVPLVALAELRGARLSGRPAAAGTGGDSRR